MTTEDDKAYLGRYFESTKNHGPCDYCGEDIVTKDLELGNHYSMKLDNEVRGRWHKRCYYEVMLNLLLSQKKNRFKGTTNKLEGGKL